MLEGLDRIDWSKLGHAYGPATDVPGLLRQLASADIDDRKNAMHELYGNIWHQGTVYEASAHAVSFLIELLQAEDVGGKDEILILLADLAQGTSYHDVHQDHPILKQEAGKPEWQLKIQKELVWVRNVKAAVKAGQNTYLGFLADTEPALREAVTFLLAALDRPAPDVAERIWGRFEKESEERVQASLLLGFGTLGESSESNLRRLQATLASAPSKSLRLAAAMSLVRLAPANLPQSAIEILIDAVECPDDYEVLAKSIWGQIDDFEMLVINHLTRLDEKSAAAAESVLARILPTLEPHQALGIVEVLLTITFKEPISRDATFASLTEQQQRVLRLVAKNRNVWFEKMGREETNSVKASLLMRSCGLPEDLIKLLLFIGDTAGGPEVVTDEKPGFRGLLKKFTKRNPPA
jgi:hypothetical protein